MKRALLLALLLAGCAVPDVHPRATPVAAADLGLSATPAPAIADDWWTRFGDPQLDRIVADALAGNPTLDVAMARVRQASATADAAGAATAPQVTADGQEQYGLLSGHYIYPPPYAGSLRFIGTTVANLNYDLDLFGRQRAAIEQAKASAEAARLDAAAARLALTGAVVQSYLELARAERLVQIAQGSVTARREGLRLTQVRIRNQLATQIDARAQETLVAQADQALLRARAQRAVTVHALAALAGRGADYYGSIAPTALHLDAGLPLPARLPADLLSRRPDLLAAKARIAAAAAGRQVARRAYYPNVNLVGLAGLQAIGLSELFSINSTAAYAGPAIHLPIFDGGRLRADLKGATAAEDVAIGQYDDRVLGAVRDAADALTRIGAADADARRGADVVRDLAETNRLNGIRVSSGLQSRLALVDPDIRLLAAQQDVANLQINAALARVQLVLALGGGFSEGPNR